MSPCDINNIQLTFIGPFGYVIKLLTTNIHRIPIRLSNEANLPKCGDKGVTEIYTGKYINTSRAICSPTAMNSK